MTMPFDFTQPAGRSSLLVRSLVVIAVVLLANAARADTELARQSYMRASGHFNLGEYRDALTDFKESYRQSNDPALLFNIAQCHRLLGEKDVALRYYRTFLRERPDAPNRPRVLEYIAAIERELPPAALQKPETTPPLTPTTDPKPPTTTVQPRVSTTQPSSIERTTRPWYRNPTGWALVCGGVAIAAAGGGLLGHAGDLNAQAGTASSLPQERSFVSDRNTFQGSGWALVGVGVAAVVSGALVWAVGAHRKHASIAELGSQRASVGIRGAW